MPVSNGETDMGLTHDNVVTSTPEAPTPPLLQPTSAGRRSEARQQTPSSDGEYLTPQRQLQNPPMTVYETENVELTQIRQQRPDVLRGEVYFDFWYNQYRLPHNRETIDGCSAIYLEWWGQCYYIGMESKWKGTPLVEFPDHTSTICINLVHFKHKTGQ